MDIKVIFSSQAASEVRDSFHWYENRVEGLGERFISFLDSTIELIIQHPEAFPTKTGYFREAALKKFPYLIIYEYLEKEQTVYILHIFNTRRHPKLKYI